MTDMVHSSISSTSSVDTDPPPPRRRKPGGWKAIKYIIGNETFEKLASMSLMANMTLYLQNQYNMGGVVIVNVVSIWSGSSNVASLAGAFISDTFLGRFRTLLFGSIFSLMGMGTMTLTAGLPQLRPTSCNEQSTCPQPQSWQLGVLFGGLALLAIGAGGIRPCNIAFGADQFDTRTEKGRAQLQSFFHWWYFTFTIALVIALTGVVYIQSNISWMIGFAIPTACLGLSITIFLIGCHCYIYAKPQGSVFTDLFKVVTAACGKRRFKVGSGCKYEFYDPPLTECDQEQTIKLKRTNRFKFLDKAAIVTNTNEFDSQGLPKNSWRLCSLQQVEQLKCLISVIPVWVSGIGCFVSMDQQSTFGILQALQMDKSIGSFKMPPAWMNLTSMIALSIWIFIYESIHIPVSRKISKKDRRLSMQARIKIGIIFSILCMAVAGFIEKMRHDSALKNGSYISPMTVAYLLPQYILSGLTEAFGAVAIMEFLTTQLSENMRTVSGAIFFLSLSLGSYISSLIVNIIHSVTGRDGDSPWLGGHDLNKNKLQYYYYIIAGLGAVNFVYFSFFASRFVLSSGGGGGTETKEVELEKENLIACDSRNMPKCETIDEEMGCKMPDK